MTEVIERLVTGSDIFGGFLQALVAFRVQGPGHGSHPVEVTFDHPAKAKHLVSVGDERVWGGEQSARLMVPVAVQPRENSTRPFK